MHAKLCCCCCTATGSTIKKSEGSFGSQTTSLTETPTLWTLKPDSLPIIMVTCPSTPSIRSKMMNLSNGLYEYDTYNSIGYCKTNSTVFDISWPQTSICTTSNEYFTGETAATSTWKGSCTLDFTTANNEPSGTSSEVPECSIWSREQQAMSKEDGRLTQNSITGTYVSVASCLNDGKNHITAIPQHLLYAFGIICVWCTNAVLAFIERLF